MTGETPVLVAQASHRLTDFLHQLRANFSHHMANLPQPLAGYCRRLLIGEQDPATASEMVAVKQLGIIHLFCLSGLHLVVLCGVVRGLFARLGLTKETSRGLLLILLPLYWVVGGRFGKPGAGQHDDGATVIRTVGWPTGNAPLGDQFVNSNPHQSEYPLVNGGPVVLPAVVLPDLV